MNNFKQPGKTMTLTAPYAVSSGGGALVGGIFGIAVADVASGDEGEFMLEGVFEHAKTSAQQWTQGASIYWNTSTKKLDSTDSVGPLIGFAAEAAANPSSTGLVRISAAPIGESLAYANGAFSRQVRKRFTIAEVNAGATLVAAVPDYKIRMLDVIAIAIGGNAATGTTVDILGTQSTSSVKLAAFAQASLTRSTVLRPGVSGCTVLADGASFVACDEETAVTIGKTGSDFATATHIDVIFEYALDAA